MLTLKQICKDYPAGGDTVHALKGIDLQFRKSEFVAILGPSGCGKTTMLNIIGGLDSYTSGDLVINGVSTKHYKDRDWDGYRNHSIGFVFQSYNLIPHQTVLQNVELALSLSGVSKNERRQRAKAALESVGLADQLKKKPAEMSGGQMQRVAIARALVNDPDIILADEPTGALDTQTSLQVMEILKEVAKERLVIMVTHNPDLADQYATRTIGMLDGVITSDSMPLTPEEAESITAQDQATKRTKKAKKPSMKFATSFGLSLKNLFTKKGRTALTSFAGSIGIIGIALITAVSQGMTTYIDLLQEDTLSSYPLTLEAQHMDISTLMTTFMAGAASSETHDKDAVYQKGMLYDMLNALNALESHQNDLTAFKTYIQQEQKKEDSEGGLHQSLNGVQYTYAMDLLVYTKNVDGNIVESDTNALMQELLAEYMGMELPAMMGGGSSMGSMSSMSSMSAMSTGLWQELLAGEDGDMVNPLLEKQYDLVYGAWPKAYNQIVLVLDENNELDDLTLYALGLKSKEDIDKLADAALNKKELEAPNQKWSYKEICQMEFRTVLGADCFTKDDKTGLWTDLRETQAGMKYLYDKGTKLQVTGIIRPNEDAVSTMLTGSIGYTHALTEYVIQKTDKAPAVQAQKKSPDVDIFSGLPFKPESDELTDAQKADEFKNHLNTLDEAHKAEAYQKMMSIPAQKDLDAMVDAAMQSMDRAQMEETLVQALTAQMGMAQKDVADYLKNMNDEDLKESFAQLVAEKVKMDYAAKVQTQLAAMTPTQLVAALDASLPTMSNEMLALYYDQVLTFAQTDYDQNMRTLSVVDLDTPATINLFASSFENKDRIEEAIAKYNKELDELEQIRYTDYVGLMMESVTIIINAITYVLVAFVAISLVVSSIMIGVITLISVQERTKEIGILRAIGASKKNVSRLFNAETMIIGFLAGLVGVGVTYLLCIPINMILHLLTGIPNLDAILPWPVALILVAVSLLLTLFAGIIPSRSAAKKDPVVALRSE